MVECTCFCFIKSVKFHFTVYNTAEGYKVPSVCVDEMSTNPEKELIDELEKKGLEVEREHIYYFGEDTQNNKICYLVGVKLPVGINNIFFLRSLKELTEMICSAQRDNFSKLIDRLKISEEFVKTEENDFGEIVEAVKKYGLE